jgi:hypothetical protein
VASAPFRAVVRTSARTLHRSLFESAGQNLVLSLPDVSVLVRGALANVNPELAAKIPPGIETKLASPDAERAFTRFIDAWVLVGRILWAAWALLFLGLAAVVASIWVAPERQTALVRAGSGLFGVAIALIAVLPAGRVLAAAVHQTRAPWRRAGLWAAFFSPVKPLAVMRGQSVSYSWQRAQRYRGHGPVRARQTVFQWFTASLRPVPARPGAVLAAGTYALANPSGAAAGSSPSSGCCSHTLGCAKSSGRDWRRGQAWHPQCGEARAWRTVAVVAAVLVVALGGTALRHPGTCRAAGGSGHRDGVQRLRETATGASTGRLRQRAQRHVECRDPGVVVSTRAMPSPAARGRTRCSSTSITAFRPATT